MRAALVVLAAVLLLVAACGNEGATKFGGALPSPETTFGGCAFCHHDIAARMVATGGHHDLGIKCEFCHADLKPDEFGPGHRSVPACADCHSEQMTHHDPSAQTAVQCIVCHTPHGSPNRVLVHEEVPITMPLPGGSAGIECASDGDCPAGLACIAPERASIPTSTGRVCAAPITFTNLTGRADGSFASSSDPGTGICEVCHTTTAHYRSKYLPTNGPGSSHFTLACFTCHPHTAAFRPSSAPPLSTEAQTP